ncbi:MAG: hypothetical protein OM95_04815 [Bdellovibrio sp. ArHS]|uniref:esterase-like activity of phytase family protein n=1 Tax=Bdellovibrio sp. ArHS TaxID=1569284 RepID=UPI000583D74C|nr:esterase-like activity of phytase family protein [Bdellovibrio sp. ArHS]KHD89151.1 MAG: hypothetical protein OM95_04815 [Bdellovibrio sp. ArHS]
MVRACGIFLSLFLGFQAQALRLQYVGETSLKSGTQFQKTTLGGFSGIAWANNILFALSDDRGRFGEPRFYEFDLFVNKKTVSLKPKAVHFLKGIPKEDDKEISLDAEGLVRLTDGEFIVSSEGNNNTKPRQRPRLFRISREGVWKSDIVVPDKYLPEPLGQQKKGIQNNMAFEGLTSFAEGKYLFVANEGPLLQDSPSNDAEGAWIRIIKYESSEGGGYKARAEFAYQVDALSSSKKGSEVFRGVSEILALSETQLLVLERGVRVSSKELLAKSVRLYLADVSKATDVAKLFKLSDGKYTGATKTLLLDFETDLTKERTDKSVENFEALAWGPKLADGRRSLLVMVDNNFSKKEVTELLVFAVEGE